MGFVASQVAAMDTLEVQHLWLVSTLLGLSYGSLFNVMPMLILEWFGMRELARLRGLAKLTCRTLQSGLSLIQCKDVMADG